MQTKQPKTLFSFGTLTLPAVQESLFGAPVPQVPATLLGHGLVDVEITDPEVVRLSGLSVHRGLARRVEGSVDGAVLSLTAQQLAAADAYEVDAYVRRRVLVSEPHNGTGQIRREAWAYVAANPVDAAERIAVAGDSIAFGLDDPAGGWAGALARHHGNSCGRRFWNLAVPGLTLHELDQHLERELALRRVDTALIGVGLNDLRADRGPARPVDLVATTDNLCARLEAIGCRPVILTPLWVDAHRADAEFGVRVRLEDVADYRRQLLAWAKGTYRDVVDLWTTLEGRPECFTDGVHPNAEGHTLLWHRLRGAATSASPTAP